MADELLFPPDGEAAIHRMEEDAEIDIDVIFLDINMLRMNGLEFLEAIEQADKIQLCGAVAVLASTDLTPGMQAKFAEIPSVKTFIRKPMTTDELVATAQILTNAR